MTGKFRNAEKYGLAIRDLALSYPEATEAHPWGEVAIKVKNKTFVWLAHEDESLSLTVKLPVSRDFALVFDFAEAAGYGLGRSGWITCRFAPEEIPDVELMQRWIVESYRAVAPKKLAAALPDPIAEPETQSWR